MTTQCGGPATGKMTKLLFEPGASPHTFDDDSERYELLEDANPMENFQRHGRLIGGQGVTGKMYRLRSRVRHGGYFTFGRIVLNPSPGYLHTLLPYLVGDDAWLSADPKQGYFIPGNCLNTFGALLDRDGYTHEFKDGVIARWILEGSAPQFREQGSPDLLKLTMDCIFKDDVWDTTTWPSPEPSLPTGLDYSPYIWQDCDGQFTIEGSDREVYGFRLEVINKIKPRYANSLTMSSLIFAGRIVKLGLALPFDANNDDLYQPSDHGAECRIKFDLDEAVTAAYNAAWTEIRLTNLKFPAKSPHAADEYDLNFEQDGEAYGDEFLDRPEFTIKNFLTVCAATTPAPTTADPTTAPPCETTLAPTTAAPTTAAPTTAPPTTL